jgi:hypothetical protein
MKCNATHPQVFLYSYAATAGFEYLAAPKLILITLLVTVTITGCSIS